MYYSTLYNIQEDKNTPTLPTHISLPKLNDSQLIYLNRPFPIRSTVEALPNCKSPGSDGLTGEYYKSFHHILTPHMYSLFSNAASSSLFAYEMLNATVITIPKPGKEATSPKNFRPISLLNLDIKIYAKLIANRLVDILPSLSHNDQIRFTKGQQSSDAKRRLINIIHMAETTGTPSLLLSLVAEKAFDRVNWKYLHSILNKFGFQVTILKAIG